jgi:hypothetical protein
MIAIAVRVNASTVASRFEISSGRWDTPGRTCIEIRPDRVNGCSQALFSRDPTPAAC